MGPCGESSDDKYAHIARHSGPAFHDNGFFLTQKRGRTIGMPLIAS